MYQDPLLSFRIGPSTSLVPTIHPTWTERIDYGKGAICSPHPYKQHILASAWSWPKCHLRLPYSSGGHSGQNAAGPHQASNNWHYVCSSKTLFPIVAKHQACLLYSPQFQHQQGIQGVEWSRVLGMACRNECSGDSGSTLHHLWPAYAGRYGN